MSVLEGMVMRRAQAAAAGRSRAALRRGCVCLALAFVACACGGQQVGSRQAVGGELATDGGKQEQGSVSAEGNEAALPLDAVVATVNGEKLCVRDVERLVAEATGGRAVVAEGLPRLRAEALEQLIHRKLVLAELMRRKLLPAEQEVEAALDALRQQLARRQIAFDAYLEQRLHTEESLRRQIVWDLAWRSYVLSQLSEQALQQAFARHQKHVDGTEVRVSHILLRVPDAKDAASLQAAIDRAQRIREEIVAGQLTFAQAAEKYSAGPSRRRGGDLGFIPRRDRMVEAFSAAAFALQVGEISQPVVTQFGVHLILCTEIKPGTKTWSDVRGELELIVARERFDALAAELRPKASIEYTGVYPYLDGGRLVVPNQ
jgi:parvulin-like peptidyl-prolyl isomerase